MNDKNAVFTAGVDVGAECVKAVVVDSDERVRGRAIVPSRGYFDACAQESLDAALDDAQVEREQLASLAATGFGARVLEDQARVERDISCHALSAYRRHPQAITVIDIGGRDPKVIRVDDSGQTVESRSIRKCAVGIGSFLMYTARHLDVHPTRLQELAASADKPARIGGYCSVFGSSEILEQLRDGARREEIALGAMYSVGERIAEVGGFTEPIVITGGVAEYFPGVYKAIGELTGLEVHVIPDPISAGAYGAAIKALAEVCCHDAS
jgi:predicted CoA-substrate-specific enzyme activase